MSSCFCTILKESENTNLVYFRQKKTCGIHCRVSLISTSHKKKNWGHIKYVLNYFRSDAENSEVCYQMQEGGNPVNKDHCVKMQIFIEQL